MDENLMISGQWINKHTQEVINVINNVIDGNEMTLITDKGVISMTDFEDYVQLEPGQEIPVQNTSTTTSSVDTAKITVDNDDITAIARGSRDVPSDTERAIFGELVKDKPKPKSKTNPILEKFFKKIPNIDKLLEISINKNILPLEHLETIITYMDLTIDDISNYIIDNIMDKEYINNIIKQELTIIFENTNSICEIKNDDES